MSEQKDKLREIEKIMEEHDLHFTFSQPEYEHFIKQIYTLILDTEELSRQLELDVDKYKLIIKCKEAMIEEAKKESAELILEMRREYEQKLTLAKEVAKKQVAYELFENEICPMCYRLNPQHATADHGEGCHECSTRRYWQALKEEKC